LVELIDLPQAARRPAGIAIGPADDIWCLALDGNVIVRYERATRKFTLFPIPTGGPDLSPSFPPEARTVRPFGLAFDHQGNLWFSEQYTGQLSVLALAAPKVRVFAPSGDVSESDPLVTSHSLDRVSGIDKVEYFLDGKPVTPTAGRLQLFKESPGEHRLQIRVSNRAGKTSVAESEFTYKPSASAVEKLFETLDPIDGSYAALRDGLRNELRRLAKQGRNAELARLLMDADRHRDGFRNFPRQQVLTLATYFYGGTASVEVQILNEAPYFSPPEIHIRAGDRITWRYDPPPTGHESPHLPEQVQIAVEKHVLSPMMRMGERFDHRFLTPGRYRVSSSDRPEAQGFIEVTAND
jgi:plastocyanin